MNREKSLKVLLGTIDANARKLHEIVDELEDADIEKAKVYCDIVRLRAVEMLYHFREMQKEASN